MVIITAVKGNSQKVHSGRTLVVLPKDNQLHLSVERVDAIVRRSGFDLHELFASRFILRTLWALESLLWANVGVEIDAAPLIGICGQVDSADGMRELLRGISFSEITEEMLKEPAPTTIT